MLYICANIKYSVLRKSGTYLHVWQLFAVNFHSVEQSSPVYCSRRSGISQPYSPSSAEALSDLAHCTSLGAGEVCMNKCCVVVIAILGSARRCVCVLQGKCRDWWKGNDVSALTEYLNDVYTCVPVRNTGIAYRYAIPVLRTGTHV